MTAKMALVTSLLLAVFAPTRAGHLRFVQLTTPLVVSAEKSHPPYIAFNESEKLSLKDPWDLMDEREASVLGTEDVAVSASFPLALAEARILRLETLRISKTPPATLELPGLQVAAREGVDPLPPVQDGWIRELPTRERVRLEQARLRHEDLLESPAPVVAEKTWRERASDVIARAQAEAAKPSSGIIVGSGTDESGRVVQNERSVARVEIAPEADDGFLDIAGEFQLQNLAYLNEHTIEIRRRHEGVYEEKGRVEPLASTYNIRVGGRTGEVVIRMRDRSDKIIGESSFSLSRFRQENRRGTVRGPKVVLQAKSDIAGRALPTRYAGTKMNDKTIAGVAGDAFMGASDIHVARNGDFELNNIKKGSFSVVSMTAKDHERSSMLVAAGFRSDIPLFPTSMIKAMKEIVSEQRRQSLDDPESSVIWGQARVDGKVVSGVQVEVESAPGYEPIYFNEWMLPDPSLKATSSNGTYAFIGVPEGLHALLGRRGDKYFSHQNVVVQKKTVALGNLDTGHESEQAIFRVFDAFTGDPRPAEIVHQGVVEPLRVGGDGAATALLGAVHRLSLSQVRPESPYAPARYYSDDERGYVHYPLIREDWVAYMRSLLKIDDQPGTSVVVGFVTHEDFSVDVLDPVQRAQIAYFDATGRPAPQGVAGGGFVIFGLSEGVREILVTSGKTGELAAQTVASDPGALTVLRFQED